MIDRGEHDLARLLANLQPMLSPERYRFESTDDLALDEKTFALVREEEGITAIRASHAGEWARISLGVHSGLRAVGLTAAVAEALAAEGISANVVAAQRHDHIFVPWDRRQKAVEMLRSLA